MSEERRKKGKFKAEGVSILNRKSSDPMSIKEFLKDSSPMDGLNSENCKDTFAQDCKISKANDCEEFESLKINRFHDKGAQSEGVTRLHVHIRKDLADKILETVFKRKRDRKIMRKDATQRIIIEQALEDYFKKNQI
jgi:hypothetical protein